MQNIRPTLGVIVSNRNFFADSLVAEGRKKILEKLAQFGVDVVIVDEQTTKLGAVESWSDSQKCAELFKRNQDRIDGILVTLPNFGDEKGVADAIRLSGLTVPVLVHAFPDTTSELTVAGRRDAFCGKFSVTNNLYQYGIKYSLTERHTVDPDAEEFKDEIAPLCADLPRGAWHALGATGRRRCAAQRLPDRPLQRKAAASVRHQRVDDGSL